jgi:hypothetical protein
MKVSIDCGVGVKKEGGSGGLDRVDLVFVEGGYDIVYCCLYPEQESETWPRLPH